MTCLHVGVSLWYLCFILLFFCLLFRRFGYLMLAFTLINSEHKRGKGVNACNVACYEWIIEVWDYMELNLLTLKCPVSPVHSKLSTILCCVIWWCDLTYEAFFKCRLCQFRAYVMLIFSVMSVLLAWAVWTQAEGSVLHKGKITISSLQLRFLNWITVLIILVS